MTDADESPDRPQPRQSRRAVLASLSLVAVPSRMPTDSDSDSDSDAPDRLNVALDANHDLVVEYRGVFDRLLATDRLLYLSSFDAVEWRDVLADGERAAVYSVDTTGLERPPVPPTARMFTVNGAPPLRTTTAAEWLADPTIEPHPGPDTRYWRCDAPVYTGNGGAIAFPVDEAATTLTLRFDDGDRVDDVLEVPADD